MRYVLDSSAIIAYLWDERGAAVTDSLLSDRSLQCYAHAINVCEVYYHLLRHSSEKDAEGVLTALLEAGLLLRSDMDTGMWKQAARFKSLGRIALADCFCLALAKRLDATVVTADRHEFEPLVAQGDAQPILFIR